MASSATTEAIAKQIQQNHDETNELKRKIAAIKSTLLRPHDEQIKRLQFQITALRRNHDALEQKLVGPCRDQITKLGLQRNDLEQQLEQWKRQRTFPNYMKLPPELRMIVCDYYCRSQIMRFGSCLRCIPVLLPLAQVSTVVRKELLEVAADHIVPLQFVKPRDPIPHRESGICKTLEIFLSIAPEEQVADFRFLQIIPAASVLPPGLDDLGLVVDIAKGQMGTVGWPGIRGSKLLCRPFIFEGKVLEVAERLQRILDEIVHRDGLLHKSDVKAMVEAIASEGEEARPSPE